MGRNAGKGGGAGSVCVEGIAYATDGLGGACYHNAVGRIEVVGCAVDIVESGLHLTVLTEEIPVAIDRHSHVQSANAGSRIEVIFGTVNGLPAGTEGTVVLHVVVAAIQVQPADDQSTVGLCVIIFVGGCIVDQAGQHKAVGIKEV